MRSSRASRRRVGYVAIGEDAVQVPGLATLVPFYGYRGDSSWLGYVQIQGRWFSAPGEVDVPDNFLTQTGLHVGDSFGAMVNGQPLPLMIVGSILDNAETSLDVPHNVVIRGDWATLAGADPTLQPSEWEVATNDLMSPASYAEQLREQTQGFADASTPSSADTDQGFLFFEGVIASLGAILVLVSLGGVANTVLLEARERLRETAILRALGMTPRQVVTMTVASVVPLAFVAAAIGIPIGAALQRSAIETMAQRPSNLRARLDHERLRPDRAPLPDWRRAGRRAGRSMATSAEIGLDIHRRRARHRIAKELGRVAQ